MLELKIVKPDDAMDWLTFVSSLVGSVAWPVVIFATAFLFRRPISRLIDRIKKMSIGDKSVDFTDQLDEAEVDATATMIPNMPPASDDPAIDHRTAQLANLSPTAAVLDAWGKVERKALQLAEPIVAPSSSAQWGRIPFRAGVKALHHHGMITAGTFNLLGDLQQLRNSAAHGGDVTVADAIRFTTLAKQALLLLDGPDVRPDPPEGD
jgi:hypothetical protein